MLIALLANDKCMIIYSTGNEACPAEEDAHSWGLQLTQVWRACIHNTAPFSMAETTEWQWGAEAKCKQRWHGRLATPCGPTLSWHITWKHPRCWKPNPNSNAIFSSIWPPKLQVAAASPKARESTVNGKDCTEETLVLKHNYIGSCLALPPIGKGCVVHYQGAADSSNWIMAYPSPLLKTPALFGSSSVLFQSQLKGGLCNFKKA